jgi:hypothetical protein
LSGGGGTTFSGALKSRGGGRGWPEIMASRIGWGMELTISCMVISGSHFDFGINTLPGFRAIFFSFEVGKGVSCSSFFGFGVNLLEKGFNELIINISSETAL